MTTYTDLIKLGDEAIGMGDFESGLRFYRSALHDSQGGAEEASARQCTGIALRLKGLLAESEAELINALQIAQPQSILSARIKRDLGMTILDRAVKEQTPGKFDDAEMWFDESRKALDTAGDPVEAAVSIGFMARSMFLRGDPAAIVVFRNTHKVLKRQNNVYELNNLVWLARASAVDRWRHAIRVYDLVILTEHKVRGWEYCAILVGGNRLYERLRARS